LYEVVTAGDGKLMVMDAKGRIGWYPASVLSASTPLGFFAYSLFGKPHAAVGPAPPPGASNPRFTWHLGKPVANTRATPKVAAVAPASVPPPVAAQAAVDASWERAVIRAHGRVGG
jgi:hypothetical protein